jgi:hypothetical protein
MVHERYNLLGPQLMPALLAGLDLCHELLRWETEHLVGQWFPWSRVNAAVLGDIAVAAGFLVTHIVDVQDSVIAVLRARTDVEKR